MVNFWRNQAREAKATPRKAKVLPLSGTLGGCTGMISPAVTEATKAKVPATVQAVRASFFIFSKIPSLRWILGSREAP